METKVINYSEKAIAVIGDTKQYKDAFKKLGGRFNPRLTCGAGWIFSKKVENDVNAILGGEKPKAQTTVKKSVSVNDKEFFDEYMSERLKYESNPERWREYYAKEFSSAVRLSNGGLFVFEKPRINTSFCFGYHDSAFDTESYDSANMMVQKAMTDEEYFTEENLGEIDKKISVLNSDEKVFIMQESCNDKPYNIYSLTYGNLGTIIRWKQDYERRGLIFEEVSLEDRKNILKGFKHERDKFLKRIQSYLKRYGLSKVHSWSYWADR